MNIVNLNMIFKHYSGYLYKLKNGDLSSLVYIVSVVEQVVL